ncbi:hypothetical protein CH063_08212 [Colletotrichum higginsianum]|uniref:Uncharacterized protein n=1 Tax=Colletotrichum higginsianum (strain IMI 349063) TaxID=759273 RepID=H1V903_COLHI|nr:hypothetical protein CH063_08212 [Colletotrichum higginsianum]
MHSERSSTPLLPHTAPVARTQSIFQMASKAQQRSRTRTRANAAQATPNFGSSISPSSPRCEFMFMPSDPLQYSETADQNRLRQR